jgi:hypothetical protein
VIKFSVLLKALMSFPNQHHQLIILCLLSFALCCYFIYISRNISPDKFFSIIYRQCYSSFLPTIHWSYKSSISYNKQLINSFIKYLLDTCDEINYLHIYCPLKELYSKRFVKNTLESGVAPRRGADD